MNTFQPAVPSVENPVLQGSGTVFDSGIRFQCRRCGSCCTGDPGLILVTGHEIGRIARFLEKPVEEVLSESIGSTPEGLSIRERSDGACLFFEKTGCRIYPVRPLSCQTYPFWISTLRSSEAWEKTCRSCPGIGTGKQYSREEILEIIHLRLKGCPEVDYP